MNTTPASVADVDRDAEQQEAERSWQALRAKANADLAELLAEDESEVRVGRAVDRLREVAWSMLSADVRAAAVCNVLAASAERFCEGPAGDVALCVVVDELMEGWGVDGESEAVAADIAAIVDFRLAGAGLSQRPGAAKSYGRAPSC